jgi:uncharacterized protein with ATP-grasp and redox domains
MKPHEDCAPCIIKWVFERGAVSIAREKRFVLLRSVLSVLASEFRSMANLGLICNQCVDAISGLTPGAEAHYKGIKRRNNQAAKELLPLARDFIRKSKTEREKIERGFRIAAAGNVAPIGAPSGAFEFPEVERILRGEEPMPVVPLELFQALRNAQRILYVADNAGEIGFDALLISHLKEMGKTVRLLVKEPLFFEDATTEDASFFHLDTVVDETRTVKNVFIPSQCTPSLNEVLRRSDLVISKGTGNYEGLKGELDGRPVIYMLKVKCRPVSEKIGEKRGSFAIKLEN